MSLPPEPFSMKIWTSDFSGVFWAAAAILAGEAGASAAFCGEFLTGEALIVDLRCFGRARKESKIDQIDLEKDFLQKNQVGSVCTTLCDVVQYEL
jgi:hypothetical protein